MEPLAGGGRRRPHGAINNLVDIEVDIRDGSDGRPPKDGTIALGNLILRYGPLPPTLTASSPSGGVHRLFSYVEGVHGGTERLGSGIDVLSDGDYAVMPPSHGLYRWMDERPITELPQAWIEHLRALDGPTQGVFSGPPEAPPEQIAAQITVTPNDASIDWSHWNSIGMAAFRASAGSPEGFAAFDAWELKAPVLRCRLPSTRARWEAYRRSPPTRIGAGTYLLPCRRSRPQLARTNKPSVG